MRSDPSPTPKEHGAHTLKVWSGTVVGAYGDDVFVELGPRMQGVISVREFGARPSPGDTFEFTLRGQEADLWVLALREGRSLSSWEDMEPGSLVRARVQERVPKGLRLKIGPLHAFLPRSQIGVKKESEVRALVGRTITCEVTQVDPEREQVLVSRKIVQQRERESRHQRRVGSLEPGQVVHARVTRIEDYGAFVRFGKGMEGLVHVSDLSVERIDHPSEVVREGDSVEAKILYIRQGGKRIGLGLKQLRESPWKAAERLFYRGQIVEGTVTRVEGYGAFVALRPGVEGLLHNSESGRPDGRLRDVLRVDEPITVRIADLDFEAERASLSLLHATGAPIAPGEAEAARSFADLIEGDPKPEPLGTKLGDVLKRALEQTEEE